MKVADENNDLEFDINIPDVLKREGVSYKTKELAIIDDLRDLPPNRNYVIGFNVAVLCTGGKMEFDVGGEHLTMHNGQVLICHSHLKVTNLATSSDFKCRVLCVSDRILKNILQAQINIWNFALYQCHYSILDVNTKYAEVFREMAKLFHHAEGPFKQEILISMLRATFLMLCERLTETQEYSIQETDGESSRPGILFQQFLALIQQRRIKKISVTQYAKELQVKPKYLSAVCLKISGKSPIEWITENVIQDICQYLRCTEYPVKEISNILGFPNPSFFGKFVRKHLGCTPTAYRRKTRS